MSRYAEPMSVLALRARLLLAVVLLLGLLFFSVACLCLSDHSAQAANRAVDTIAALPAFLVEWPDLAVAVVGISLVLTVAEPRGRASPVFLQRFLF